MYYESDNFLPILRWKHMKYSNSFPHFINNVLLIEALGNELV